MPTERLYYLDSYLTAFDATVLRAEHADGKPVAVLNRTAFYPTSGGQPFDTGHLGDARVLDVIDRNDGTIGHVLDRDPIQGSLLRGAVDWKRRFDHMQQHTGQHLLSAAFDRLLDARTVSLHLGAESSTVDLNRSLSLEEIAKADVEANRVVWDDRPVTVRFVDAEEAATMGLRKESRRAGTLRVIEIADFDLSACGGTHVARTGAVGIIAVQSWERFKGGTRVAFVCGGRALRAFGALRDCVAEAVRRLSVLPGELPAAIERSQTQISDFRKIVKSQQERLAVYQAVELAGRAMSLGAARLVAEIVQADGSGLKSLTTAIVSAPGFIVALVSSSPSSGPLVVIGRSKDVECDVREVLRALTNRFGGRGGGSAELAQGGGFTATPEVVVAHAREIISTAG
jgi:alanyl-tRNA synthetase